MNKRKIKKTKNDISAFLGSKTFFAPVVTKCHEATKRGTCAIVNLLFKFDSISQNILWKIGINLEVEIITHFEN